MIPLRTPAEIDAIAEAGAVLGRLFTAIEEHVKPGATTAQLDRFAEDFIRAHDGAVPSFKGLYGFPASLCTSINHEVVHGIPSGKRVVRGRGRWAGFADANFMAPLIVPTIVIAVAMYLFLAKVGLLGTALGLAASHVVLAVPFVVLVMGVAIRGFDERVEQVAFTLGASRSQTILRVLLPNLAPSLASAWILALIVSFDEVIVTLFVAGTYQTVPKRMFNELILQINPTITAIATLLIVFSIVTAALVALLMRRGGLLRFGAEGES